MTPGQKKDLARTLYLTNNFTQKVIAEKVGSTEKTIGKWAKEEKWDMQRKSLLTSNKEQLVFLYNQLDAIKKELQDHERAANSKEADAILKLTAAIKNLQIDTGATEIIEVFTKFLNWLSKEDLALAQKISPWMDTFLQENLD